MRRASASLHLFVAAVVLPLFLSAAYAASGSAGDPTAPRDSGGPIRLPGVQIDNFGLCAGRIYRGEQPRGKDYAALASLGITTVIDLRDDARRDAGKEAEAAGLTYVNIPLDDQKTPTDEAVVAFLSALDKAGDGKVFVHCAGGRHRTGAMIAVYRMVREGWTAEQAYNEMLAYDFYTRRGHMGYKTYVFDYYERMKHDPGCVPEAYCSATASSK